MKIHYDLKVLVGNYNLLESSALSESQRSDIVDLFMKNHDQALGLSRKEWKASELPENLAPLKNLISGIAKTQFPQNHENIRYIIKGYAPTGLSKFTSSPDQAVKATPGQYKKGQVFEAGSWKVVYSAPKTAGCQPGFIGKKGWKKSDETKLSDPNHDFHKMACQYIQNEIDKGEKGDPVIKSAVIRIGDNIDLLINDWRVKAVMREHIKSTHPKFTKKHMIKLDHPNPYKNKILPAHSPRFLRPILSLFCHKTPHKQNFVAIMEALSNDIYACLDVQSQKLRIINAKYDKGAPKLLLDGTWLQGPQGEKFHTLEGHIDKGTIIGNKVRDENGTLHSIDSAELAKIKAIAAGLLADWDKLNRKGENLGFIIDRTNPASPKVCLKSIDPGHAQDYYTVRPPSKIQNAVIYAIRKMIYDIRAKLWCGDFMQIKNLRTDFSLKWCGFKEDLPFYANFSVFDDTLLSEKMEGVRIILDRWDDVLGIYDAYIANFSEEGPLNFKKELTEAKNRLIARKEYLEGLFAERLKLKPKELDLLDNIEKLTSGTTDHIVSSKGKKERFYHLRVQPRNRREWHMQKLQNGNYEITYTSNKLVGSHRDAKNMKKKLKKYGAYSSKKQPALGRIDLSIDCTKNKVTFKVIPSELDDIIKLFDESTVARYKGKSLRKAG